MRILRSERSPRSTVSPTSIGGRSALAVPLVPQVDVPKAWSAAALRPRLQFDLVTRHPANWTVCGSAHASALKFHSNRAVGTANRGSPKSYCAPSVPPIETFPTYSLPLQNARRIHSGARFVFLPRANPSAHSPRTVSFTSSPAAPLINHSAPHPPCVAARMHYETS